MSSALLVLTPLRLEAAALHADGRRVLRTGMGRRRARVAAARALAVEDARAVAVAGVCAAAVPALQPGDVVLGTELRHGDGPPVAVPGSALLETTLRRHGLRVHAGPIACVDRILPVSERRELGAGGVLAVDMESAWLAGGADGRPLVVLRVVVERADRSLYDPRTLGSGIRALTSLHRAGAALEEWAAATGQRTFLLADPRAPRAGDERSAGDVARRLAEKVELVLVTGSQGASDSSRLVEAARSGGAAAYLVGDERDVDLAWLDGVATVGVVAGASAPEGLVEGLVTALRALAPAGVDERVVAAATQRSRRPRKVAVG